VETALRIERIAVADWALALVLSLLINGLAFVGFAVGLGLDRIRQPAKLLGPADQVVAVIAPEWLQVAPEPVPGAVTRPFVRTSPEQVAGKSERARFLGERDTVAASDLEPVAGAEPLPSQAGREPLRDGELETTESVYQDGDLAHDRSAKPEAPAEPAPMAAAATPTGDPALAPATPAAVQPPAASRPAAAAQPLEPAAAAAKPELVDPLAPPAPVRPPEQLAVGTETVDRPLPPEPKAAREEPRPARQTAAADSVRPPAPAAAIRREPGFRGHQTKTRLRGSISRRGPSSLDVDNTSLGRYQAALSRAVEREWQRNCVRYRDFITPGFLTVRFLVEADGRIRSLEFLEVVEAGEIQKGFTLNSIRGASIPPMSSELKRDLEGEPLELIYNFYF
jgi:hypothetical protein